MNENRKPNRKFIAILNGVAALCFSLAAFRHFRSGERSMGIMYLSLAFCQFTLCMTNLKRMKTDVQEKGDE